ncbi:MAG: rhodanese-like domain-containing protein [Gammaproteobacteria bacterium]|jgi:rhodanese-related sulfurtransferase|nr:rhodanese-like domain-containing protein [Gammaproteobacteria bacterium]MBT5222793.1 rhodanese-like domain-containing protein [Gammaproteobacteria bacterium]MBT5826962.1 rhodanese-like domain-containing protein [Gammaproteobacteria bacterium]MBT6420425.1 rhodanese-like domain-containing protein [Gammaproteobacteria bacterium]MBT6574816.1 rhodanese-like domain-containing protein [Gammaproteobacteria bacterium]
MIENLTPQQSWDLMQANPSAVMIDVRTKVEHDFVGHPVNAVHVPWKEAPDWQVNPGFVEQVKQAVGDNSCRVLLLCRSGSRSVVAAEVLQEAGFRHVVNVVEGFEGELDVHKHRGNLGGWRNARLPWEQS